MTEITFLAAEYSTANIFIVIIYYNCFLSILKEKEAFI